MKDYTIECKGKTYEVTGQELDWIERRLENAEDEIRERLLDRAYELFIHEADKAEEDAGEQADKYGIRGAARKSMIEKAKKELRESLEEKAKNEWLQEELEDYKESLLESLEEDTEKSEN